MLRGNRFNKLFRDNVKLDKIKKNRPKTHTTRKIYAPNPSRVHRSSLGQIPCQLVSQLAHHIARSQGCQAHCAPDPWLDICWRPGEPDICQRNIESKCCSDISSDLLQTGTLPEEVTAPWLFVPTGTPDYPPSSEAITAGDRVVDQVPEDFLDLIVDLHMEVRSKHSSEFLELCRRWFVGLRVRPRVQGRIIMTSNAKREEVLKEFGPALLTLRAHLLPHLETGSHLDCNIRQPHLPRAESKIDIFNDLSTTEKPFDFFISFHDLHR